MAVRVARFTEQAAASPAVQAVDIWLHMPGSRRLSLPTLATDGHNTHGKTKGLAAEHLGQPLGLYVPGARDHLQANRSLEFLFDVRI
jgi:hypothetical protein